MRVLESREQILPFVYEWADLLAQNKYEEAFDLLLHPADEVWTPDLLRQLVANYGTLEPMGDGRTFRVTSPALAITRDNSKPYKDVDWFDAMELERLPGRIGMVHYDVPLNGEWSDLTAIFWVHKHDGNYVLQLEDLHVL